MSMIRESLDDSNTQLISLVGVSVKSCSSESLENSPSTLESDASLSTEAEQKLVERLTIL